MRLGINLEIQDATKDGQRVGLSSMQWAVYKLLWNCEEDIITGRYIEQRAHVREGKGFIKRIRNKMGADAIISRDGCPGYRLNI